MNEATMTPEEFDEEFGEIMLNGLNSQSTYIPLRQNKRIGINVAIRPLVFRASDDVIFFGGKLRVAFTLDGDNKPVKTKVIDLHPETAAQRLEDYCKGFSWLRQDHRRFSTVMGLGFAATKYNGTEVMAKLESGEMVNKFVTHLENQYSQYNDGASFQSRRQIINALGAAWKIQAKAICYAKPKIMPTEIVGHQSKVLNKAQNTYNHNVLSFADKVASMAVAAKEKDNAE